MFSARTASLRPADANLAEVPPVRVMVAKPVPAESLAPAAATMVSPVLALMATTAPAAEALAIDMTARGKDTNHSLTVMVAPVASMPWSLTLRASSSGMYW